MRSRLEHVSIAYMTRGRPPRLPFVVMKKAVLGEKYLLSVAFLGPDAIRRAHCAYRQRNYPTDILSFPLKKNEGEILICLSECRKRMREFGLDFKAFVGFLFIHGLLHLKGMRHSGIMKREEKKFCKRFSIAVP